MAARPHRLLAFGPFRIDLARRLLLREGHPVPLPPKAFDTLAYLVQHPREDVRTQELLAAVWPDAFVEENNLTQKISRLRKVLGDHRDVHDFIVTMPGFGYRFVADVAEVGELSSGSAAASVPASLAVLPFMPLGATGYDEVLGAGIADALITKLGNVREIVVRPTSSVLRYATPERDFRTAGRELAVEAILDGHIQRAGDRLRVTVQLLRVEDGLTLWGHDFDQEVTDFFAVQDLIAQQVARAVLQRLSGENQRLLAKQYTGDLAAHHAYLKGRYQCTRRTESSLKRSIALYEEAIAIDPEYALAHAAIADSYCLLGFHGALSPTQAFPRAKGSALRALAIDDTLAEAHASLAYVRLNYEWDWRGAETEFLRALALNPNYATAHQWYANLLSAERRLPEARESMARALGLEPLSLVIHANWGFNLYYAGQFEEAADALLTTLEMDPGFALARGFLGRVYAQQRRPDDAIAELVRAREAEATPQVLSALGYAYAIAGRRADAAAMLQELERQSGRRYVAPYDVALVHAGLGDAGAAIAWLERGFAEHSRSLIWLATDPALERLRPEPRFQVLLQRLTEGSAAVRRS